MRKGFTLIELMIVIAIIAIIAALAVPGLLNSQRASNERNASGSLKTIASAQADFRSNDRDDNRVNDFWTGDIAGLYAIDNTSTGSATPSAVKLIDVSVALADAFAFPGSLSNGNYGTAISNYGVPSSKAGYWYFSLFSDLQVFANGGNGSYKQDSDGSGDLVHHASRFGATAMPESYNSTGRRVYILNEGNTMFARDFGADVITGNPPAPTGLFDGNWPTDADVAALWSKLD
jgi:prepilin-type N-terminal cleavage/methylation domain-containing protein